MSGAAKKMARAIGWTQTDWINEVGSAIGVSSIYWFESKLAERNGKRWVARRCRDQFERELFLHFMHVAVHPVRREFDRRAAWRVAVAESRESLGRLVAYMDRQFEKSTRLRKGLLPQDQAELWSRVRQEATIMKIRERPRVPAAAVRGRLASRRGSQ